MRKLIFAIAAIAFQAHAANICVGPSATGSGSGADWNNLAAWSGTPARGDTWYLATGSYASKTLNVAASGSTLITIKKATVANHGGISTGWADTMGNGQASFAAGGLVINSSYWVIDGVTGPLWSTNTTDYGFYIANSTSGGPHAIQIYPTGSQQLTNITISHIASVAVQGSYEHYFVFGNSGGSYGSSYVTISHCFARYYENMVKGDASGSYSQEGWLVECNIFLDTFSDNSWHGEDINSAYGNYNNYTIRYNWFQGTSSYSPTGVIVVLNGASAGTFLIYGNVFKDKWTTDGVIGGIHYIMHGVVYNNTFVNMHNGSPGNDFNYERWTIPQYPPGDYGNDCTVENNLIVAGYGDRGGGGTIDYNAYYGTTNVPGSGEVHSQVLSANPFVSMAGNNLQLAANTTAGASLGAPYNVDALGNTRTTWSRGAFEYAPLTPTTFYAATNGSSANNGTSTNTPWPLDYAGTHAPSNSMVIVLPGLYSVQLAIETNATFVAQTKWTAILSNQSPSCIVIGYSSHCTGVVVDGFSVTNSWKSGIDVYSGTNTIRNCWIHGSGFGQVAQNGSGIYFENNGLVNHMLVENCLLEYNGLAWMPGDGAHDHGVYVNGTDHTIRNNISRHNQCGFSPTTSAGTCYWYNNVTYNNAFYGIAGGGTASGQTEVIVGNTILETNCALYLSGSGQYLLTNNIIQCGSSIVLGGGSIAGDYNYISSGSAFSQAHGVIGTAPALVSASTGRYWLTSGSPARSMALSSALSPVDFFDSPQSSVSDVGFVQYSAGQAADSRTLEPTPSNGADYWAYVNDPIISTQPTSKTVNCGSTATFTVGASGNSTLNYQWRKNGANITGASSSSYTTPTTSGTDNGSTFSVVVSDTAGSVTSSSATLTTELILTQPVSKTVNVGQNATFSVVGTGCVSAYQWNRNGTSIAGATQSSYTESNCQLSANGNAYSVNVAAIGTAEMSQTAYLYVTGGTNRTGVVSVGKTKGGGKFKMGTR